MTKTKKNILTKRNLILFNILLGVLAITFSVIAYSAYSNDAPLYNCKTAPQNDMDYARHLAEKGDATAAYVYASFIQHEKSGSTYDIDEGALKWLKIAAEQGSADASNVLCVKFWDYQDSTAIHIQIPEEQPEWCLRAAKHGSKSAQSILAEMYQYGTRVKKNSKEAYFWSRLGNKSKQSFKHLTKDFTEKQIEELEQEIEEWKPEEPKLNSRNRDVITPWKGAYRKTSLLPINIAGLMCGGQAGNCEIQDECGNLVGIVCPRTRPKYIIANKDTNRSMTSCPDKDHGCLDLVPREWSCDSPKNMPLSKEDQEKHPDYKNAVSCGDVLGVDHNSAGDGPYDFISKTTGEKLGSCGFWQSFRDQAPCKPPPEWTCGRPSNYGG